MKPHGFTIRAFCKISILIYCCGDDDYFTGYKLFSFHLLNISEHLVQIGVDDWIQRNCQILIIHTFKKLCSTDNMKIPHITKALIEKCYAWHYTVYFQCQYSILCINKKCTHIKPKRRQQINNLFTGFVGHTIKPKQICLAMASVIVSSPSDSKNH